MTFDDALAIVTKPTPAQEWLANVQVPEADIPERCTICGTEDCEGCLVEDSMSAYKRYRALYEDETLL